MKLNFRRGQFWNVVVFLSLSFGLLHQTSALERRLLKKALTLTILGQASLKPQLVWSKCWDDFAGVSYPGGHLTNFFWLTWEGVMWRQGEFFCQFLWKWNVAAKILGWVCAQWSEFYVTYGEILGKVWLLSLKLCDVVKELWWQKTKLKLVSS